MVGIKVNAVMFYDPWKLNGKKNVNTHFASKYAVRICNYLENILTIEK